MNIDNKIWHSDTNYYCEENDFNKEAETELLPGTDVLVYNEESQKVVSAWFVNDSKQFIKYTDSGGGEDTQRHYIVKNGKLINKDFCIRLVNWADTITKDGHFELSHKKIYPTYTQNDGYVSLRFNENFYVNPGDNVCDIVRVAFHLCLEDNNPKYTTWGMTMIYYYGYMSQTKYSPDGTGHQYFLPDNTMYVKWNEWTTGQYTNNKSYTVENFYNFDNTTENVKGSDKYKFYNLMTANTWIHPFTSAYAYTATNILEIHVTDLWFK